MRPDRKKEKVVCFNSTASLPLLVMPGFVSNGNGGSYMSSGTLAISSSSPPTRQSKPTYNACPPPPNLYPDPATPPQSGPANGGTMSSGNLSDGEKKFRRRPGRQLRQVGEPTPYSFAFSDSSLPLGRFERSVSLGQSSLEPRKEPQGATHHAGPNPSSMPTPSFTAKSEFSTSFSVAKFESRSVPKSSTEPITKNVEIRAELIMVNTSVRSEQCNISSSKSSSLLNSLPLDSSGTEEMGCGQKVKSKEIPVVVPKSTKSKDGSKTTKSNTGSAKKLASVGVDPKNLCHKGWRMCTQPVTTSNICPGSCAVPANSGTSCGAGDAVGVVSSPEDTSIGAMMQNSQSWSESNGLGTTGIHLNDGSLDKLVNGGNNGMTYGCGLPRPTQFREYLSLEDTVVCIEAGHAFSGVLHVNSFYRSEAYVTVDLVPVDILIEGLIAQNRAMEGDLVAIQVNPTSQWARMKGTDNKQSTCPEIDDICMELSSCSDHVTGNICSDVGLESDVILDCSSMICLESSMDDVELRASGVRTLGNSTHGHLENSICDDVVKHYVPDMDGKSNSHSKNRQLRVAGSTKDGFKSGKLESQRTVSHMSLMNLAALVDSMPGKRPTGRVVAIIEKSKRRQAITGYLEFQGGGSGGKGSSNGNLPQKMGKKVSRNGGMMTLIPADNRFSKMIVFASGIPEQLSKRLKDGDPTASSELVVAQVEEWKADNAFPRASIKQSLGPGGTIEAQTEALLLENVIHGASFPSSVLECLPEAPWKIPAKEFKERRDCRTLRIFTVDPPTAKDLDDALSVEQLDDGNVRIGVHIADVSYFVDPDSALDKEAQKRSTSVYLIQRVLPMLPPLLSEELCSLNPGVDRLAFSVMWIMDPAGNILDQWIGRTIICSCAKLTYGLAQSMIDGIALGMDNLICQDVSTNGASLPLIYGQHTWQEIMTDIRTLHGVAKKRRESRFDDGALKLESSRLVFTLDEDGEPYDSMMYEHQDSNIMVEEFTLLANITVAKVISNAFPERSLLRRHPEPNRRKLKDFEDFCVSNGFDLDMTSSGALHMSLQRTRDTLQDDSVLFNILMLYATKPMQLAKYFCTGDLKDQENEWAHYALAVPMYTHFTSPIRRYPDLVVHRTVAAALEAEKILTASLPSSKQESQPEPPSFKGILHSSGKLLDKSMWGTETAQKALVKAAKRHKVPEVADLSVVAAHCNERRLASRNVKEGSDKLYLWTLIKRKQGILSNARVLALGPKFISLYVCKIGMERRIYYDEIEGLNAEWFEGTGTLVLNLSSEKFNHKKYQGRGRMKRTVADVALLVRPTDSMSSNSEDETYDNLIREVEDRLAGKIISEDECGALEKKDGGSDSVVEPAVLPLTLRWFSWLPVSIHATGGENRPLDISVRLYVSSYT